VAGWQWSAIIAPVTWGDGSGGVAVGSVDPACQCGHFGTKQTMWLWLWRWLGGSKVFL
jgi:hypothetical protein